MTKTAHVTDLFLFCFFNLFFNHKLSSLTDYLCQVSQLTGHTLEVNPSQHSEHHCTQMKEAIINTADGAVYK